QERGLDRRPAPRVTVDLPVRLLTEKGVPWESTCTELSASGMKVVTRARLRPGHAVKIAFTPPGSDTPLDAVALVMRADKSGAVELTAAAGEPWDDLVRASVERGWAGLECLSGIPGLVGATPIQNVGAYGQEVSDTVTTVRVLDTESGELRTLTAAECGFGY